MVLRVYLDQNKWIDLARASTGHALGQPFADVLLMARTAVAARRVSFPLDIARYSETWKHANLQSRAELVGTMAELSRFHTIAPPGILVPYEIDRAIRHRLRLPAGPEPEVFGVGVNHAAGGGVKEVHADLVPGLSKAQQAAVEVEFQRVKEFALLLGPPDPRNLPAELSAIAAQMTQDRQFAEGATALSEQLRATGHVRGDKLDLAMAGTEFGDILQPLVEALLTHGIDPDDFFDLPLEQLLEFLDDVPSRQVTTSLRRDKFGSRQSWEPNDLDDLVHLPVAAVYCDVVVTERQWVHRLAKAEVAERYGTVVLADLRRLTEILAAA